MYYNFINYNYFYSIDYHNQLLLSSFHTSMKSIDSSSRKLISYIDFVSAIGNMAQIFSIVTILLIKHQA